MSEIYIPTIQSHRLEKIRRETLHPPPLPIFFLNSSNSFKIYHRTCKLIVLPGDLLIDEQQWATCLNKVSHLLHKLTFMSMFFNVVCKLVVICFTGGRLFNIYLSDRGRVHFYRNKTSHKLCKILSDKKLWGFFCKWAEMEKSRNIQMYIALNEVESTYI